jgi:HSP20 family protein
MATNYDPFRQVVSLADAVNRLMQDAVMRPGYAFSRGGEAPMNVIELADTYVIQVAMPGVHVTDIEVTSEQHTVTIQAQRKNTLPNSDQNEQVGYLLAEFSPGEFTRSVTLPKEFEADAIQAAFADGILTLTVPIAKRAQPKRISITPSNQEQAQLTSAVSANHN